MGVTGSCVALLMAGGTGRRFEKALPKQFFLLSGKPLIRYALETFQRSPQIDGIFVVYERSTEVQTRSIAESYSKTIGLVAGGPTRQDSVYLGLEALSQIGQPSRVLIHDCVRPFFQTVLESVVSELKGHEAVIPALDIADTLYHYDGERILSLPKREEYYRVQTPQGFSFSGILTAHRKAQEENRRDFSDDGSLYAFFGGALRLVNGSPLNIKITTPMDIPIAMVYLRYIENKGVV